MRQRWGGFPSAGGGKRAQTAEKLLAGTPATGGGDGADERLRGRDDSPSALFRKM